MATKTTRREFLTKTTTALLGLALLSEGLPEIAPVAVAKETINTDALEELAQSCIETMSNVADLHIATRQRQSNQISSEEFQAALEVSHKNGVAWAIHQSTGFDFGQFAPADPGPFATENDLETLRHGLAFSERIAGQLRARIAELERGV